MHLYSYIYIYMHTTCLGKRFQWMVSVSFREGWFQSRFQALISDFGFILSRAVNYVRKPFRLHHAYCFEISRRLRILLFVLLNHACAGIKVLDVHFARRCSRFLGVVFLQMRIPPAPHIDCAFDSVAARWSCIWCVCVCFAQPRLRRH